jgi:hypothetical protein
MTVGRECHRNCSLAETLLARYQHSRAINADRCSMKEQRLCLHQHCPIDDATRNQCLPWLPRVQQRVGPIGRQERTGLPLHAKEPPSGRSLTHLNVSSFPKQAQYEVGDVDLLWRDESDENGAGAAGLNSAVKPFQVVRYSIRSR